MAIMGVGQVDWMTVLLRQVENHEVEALLQDRQRKEVKKSAGLTIKTVGFSLSTGLDYG